MKFFLWMVFSLSVSAALLAAEAYAFRSIPKSQDPQGQYSAPICGRGKACGRKPPGIDARCQMPMGNLCTP